MTGFFIKFNTELKLVNQKEKILKVALKKWMEPFYRRSRNSFSGIW